MGPRIRNLGLAAAVSMAVLAMLGTAAPTRFPRTTSSIATALGEAAHAGDCSRCHSQHGEDAIPYAHALTGPDDNTLCASCHTVPWEGGSHPGNALFSGSAHGSEPAVVWPGPLPPPRTEPGAAGKCLNCHDPHGWEDASGVVPGLRLAREENLCLACHDGSPAATDVRSDLLRPYRHPTTDFSGRHTLLEALPSDFGSAPLNRRHAECEDCHNPHMARADRFAPLPDQTSKALLGVSRIAVVNGLAGTPPSYVYIAADDTLSDPGGDWQVCFKCHSSWTTQPAGQTDLARVLNPNNPSFHPVEAPGRDLGIDPAAFAPGWNAMSRTPCGSCHGSDSPLARGPHGSSYRYLLHRFYDPAPAPRPTTSDELCFSCHSFTAYADASAPQPLPAASRFNEPGAGKGHAKHVAEQNVPCGACHVTHGSSSLPHLLVTGRSPGIVSFTETPTGGTCAPTCHGPQSYTANYAR